MTNTTSNNNNNTSTNINSICELLLPHAVNYINHANDFYLVELFASISYERKFNLYAVLHEYLNG